MSNECIVREEEPRSSSVNLIVAMDVATSDRLAISSLGSGGKTTHELA